MFAEVSSLLKNAVINLIENALKYSPDDSIVEINASYDDNSAVIRVCDHGTGIPDSEKSRIFEKYYRVKNTKGIDGTGRGLWITKNIIENEGGKLTVSDNIDGGTVFTLVLPCYRINNLGESLQNLSSWFNVPEVKIMEKIETVKSIIMLEENIEEPLMDSVVFVNLLEYLRREHHDKNIKNIRLKLDALINKNPGGKKILIVDDSLYVHYYLGSYFNDLGYNIVGFAKDGREGVDKYFELNPDYISLDNTMPFMSGIEAAREIYSKDKDSRILFISAVGASKNFVSLIKNAIPKENFRILEKPVEFMELKGTMENFI